MHNIKINKKEKIEKKKGKREKGKKGKRKKRKKRKKGKNTKGEKLRIDGPTYFAMYLQKKFHHSYIIHQPVNNVETKAEQRWQ